MTVPRMRELVDNECIPSVGRRQDGVGHPSGPPGPRGVSGRSRRHRTGRIATTRPGRRRPFPRAGPVPAMQTRWEDPPVPIPLVIDTDPGIDDALAILLALASPEVDLRLVTTVHGNVELEQTTDNALRVLHLAGRSDVPVAAGAAVGPLTNLALLLRVFPEAAARIGRLVVMGGSAGRGGNVTAAAEFNVWADAEAAQAVLTSMLPTVLVGLDVTLPTVLDEDGIARFAAAGPIGASAAAILQQYLDHARSSYGTTGVVVHDALAVSEAIVPGMLGTVRRDVVVDTGLGSGRGQTLVDRRAVSTAATAVEVAESVDSAAAVEFLVSRLASLDLR